jgi:hypothetical protein
MGGSIVPGWGHVIGGVIGAGMGLLSAKKNRGKGAQSKEDELTRLGRERQEKIAALQAAEEKRIAPIRDALYRDASSDQPLDYASTQADLRRRYQEAQQSFRSQRTDSGLAASQAQAANLDLASQLSGAFDQGMKNRRALRMNLYSQSPINQLNWQNATSGDRMAEMINQQRIEAAKAEAASSQGMMGALGGLGTQLGQGGGLAGLFGGNKATTTTSYSSPNLQGMGSIGGGNAPNVTPMWGGQTTFGGK